MNTDGEMTEDEMMRNRYACGQGLVHGASFAETRRAHAEFTAWLAQVKRDAAREALDGLADHEAALHSRDPEVYAECLHVGVSAKSWRETHYPEDVTP